MIAALLNFHDEDPAWLARAIRSSVEALGIGALVALEGRYGQWEAEPLWPVAAQRHAIEEAAHVHDLDLTLDTATDVWPDQAAKRSRLFELGEAITEPDDWYLILDADDELQGDPGRARAELDATPADAAEVLLVERARDREQPFRALFRAIRGLHVETNHYTYATPDGRRLWGHDEDLEPALDLTGIVRMIHWTAERPVARREAQHAYYAARNLAGVERGPCARCGQPAACLMVDRPKRESIRKVSVGYVEVCPACVPWYVRRNVLTAKRIGVDPSFLSRPRNAVAGFQELVEAAARERT